MIAGTAAALFAGASVAGTTSYKYDELGRIAQVSNVNGTTTYYTYDADNVLVETDTVASGTTLIWVTAASNLRTLANNAGYTGASPGNYQFNVAPGVTLMGTAGAGKGIDTGTWPSGSTITLIVSGNVYGGGGTGGAGSSVSNGSPGNAGGDAIYVQTPITITVNASGSVKSGGGGGGGGGKQVSGNVGGDGGGGGFPNGAGGAGSSGIAGDPAVAGSPGTTSGGGHGNGTPAGGNGGDAGQPGLTGAAGSGFVGGAGGAAGYAIRKNGNTVTYTTSGTVNGTVG